MFFPRSCPACFSCFLWLNHAHWHLGLDIGFLHRITIWQLLIYVRQSFLPLFSSLFRLPWRGGRGHVCVMHIFIYIATHALTHTHTKPSSYLEILCTKSPTSFFSSVYSLWLRSPLPRPCLLSDAVVVAAAFDALQDNKRLEKDLQECSSQLADASKSNAEIQRELQDAIVIKKKVSTIVAHLFQLICNV